MSRRTWHRRHARRAARSSAIGASPVACPAARDRAVDDERRLPTSDRAPSASREAMEALPASSSHRPRTIGRARSRHVTVWTLDAFCDRPLVGHVEAIVPAPQPSPMSSRARRRVPGRARAVRRSCRFTSGAGTSVPTVAREGRCETGRCSRNRTLSATPGQRAAARLRCTSRAISTPGRRALALRRRDDDPPSPAEVDPCRAAHRCVLDHRHRHVSACVKGTRPAQRLAAIRMQSRESDHDAALRHSTSACRGPP